MTIRDKIVQLFQQNHELSAKEITDNLMVSKQMVHIVLAKLVEENKVVKYGRVPKTVYRYTETPLIEPKTELNISHSNKGYLESHFLAITEVGKMLEGIEGFDHWCKKRNLPLQKTIDEYMLAQKKYDAYKDKNGFINGMEKLKSTKGFDNIWLDDLYYLDFYAIERFGKTRLGTILHYAKQGQNKMLMRILIDNIKHKIEAFIRLHHIDAIGFVPPTIRREVQLMKVLQSGLKINLPLVNILKIGGIIPVPQKSLSKLEERISNADNTFMLRGNQSFKRLLLIDDAVGSGSTLNQVAAKIKKSGVAEHITGLAIVGSFKGFDVITDV